MNAIQAYVISSFFGDLSVDFDFIEFADHESDAGLALKRHL